MQEFNELRAFSELEENVVKGEQLLKMAVREIAPIGDDERFRRRVDGFRVVYSLEDHPQDRGGVVRCRHVSLSKDNEITPSVEDVKKVLDIFGYDIERSVRHWVEVVEGGSRTALNIVQTLEDLNADQKDRDVPLP